MGYGGESGIRTHVTLSSKHAFQACAFSHSAISPRRAASSEESGTTNPAPGRPSLPATRYLLLFLFQLLRQVILDPHLGDGVQLSLEVVNVLFLVGQDFFQQVT